MGVYTNSTYNIFCSDQVDSDPFYWRNKILSERAKSNANPDIDIDVATAGIQHPESSYTPNNRINELLQARNTDIAKHSQTLSPEIIHQIKLAEQRIEFENKITEARAQITRYMADAVNAQDPSAIAKANIMYTKLDELAAKQSQTSAPTKITNFAPSSTTNAVIANIIENGPKNYLERNNAAKTQAPNIAASL